MFDLKKLASSIAVLNQKLNNIHFNYKGDSFLPIHHLTEKMYKRGLILYDEISEKISMNNIVVPASFAEHLANSGLKEEKGQRFTLKKISDIITYDLTQIINFCKMIESNEVIQPLLDEVYIFADKYRWMFKSII